MAQIIQTICDVCQEAGEIEAGVTFRIQDVEVDLCDAHLQKMSLSAILGLIEQGHIGARPSDEDDLACPHGCNNGKPFKSMQGKRQHMTRNHK